MVNAFFKFNITPETAKSEIEKGYKELKGKDKGMVSLCKNLLSSKKRVYHEIRYFAEVEISSLENILLGGKSVKLDNLCLAIIRAGQWFEKKPQDILEIINNAREKARFKKFKNSKVITKENDSLKNDLWKLVGQYFNGVKRQERRLIIDRLVEQAENNDFVSTDIISLYFDDILDETREKEKNLLKLANDIILKFNEKGEMEESVVFIDKCVADFKKVFLEKNDLELPLQRNAAKQNDEYYLSTLFNATIIDILTKDVIQEKNEYATILKVENEITKRTAEYIRLLKKFEIYRELISILKEGTEYLPVGKVSLKMFDDAIVQNMEMLEKTKQAGYDFYEKPIAEKREKKLNKKKKEDKK